MSARSALELLCEKYRSRIFASDAIDWAIAELIEGNDSDSLRRLAATLKPTDWWEVEPLLHASFAELGYAWLDETDCYWACAEATARDIVKEQVSPTDGCARMYELSEALEFPSELIRWSALHWMYACDPDGPEVMALPPGVSLSSLIKADAATWLRTRQRAPDRSN